MSSDTEFTKDPDDVLDYEIDWSVWLGTDTISTSTWVVPTGITKDRDTHTTTMVKIWLRGGTAGTLYRVTDRIATVGGRTKDWSLKIFVGER